MYVPSFVLSAIIMDRSMLLPALGQSLADASSFSLLHQVSKTDDEEGLAMMNIPLDLEKNAAPAIQRSE
jgi:hypothetical protein